MESYYPFPQHRARKQGETGNMSTPANLYPGLNDISDALEEFPLEISRYLTLLREIDAKCVHTVPELNIQINDFLSREKERSKTSLSVINGLFQELMPSLEEKMHVSSIAFESLSRLTSRLELAYEVAIKNQEIPSKLRLGNDNHPAMHLHRELMAKIDSKTNQKSSQALKSESRREAMAAAAAGRRNNNTGTSNGVSSAAAATTTTTTTTATNTASVSPSIDAAAAAAAAAIAPIVDNTTTVPGISTTTNHIAPVKTAAAAAASTATTATANTAAGALTASERKRRGNHGNANGNTESKRRKKKTAKDEDYSTRPKVNEYGEPLYCYCNQVAYGEMVGCDGENCALEWFHLPCIGMETLPKGKWYCDDCRKRL